MNNEAEKTKEKQRKQGVFFSSLIKHRINVSSMSLKTQKGEKGDKREGKKKDFILPIFS